jgi:hypothetical protein
MNSIRPSAVADLFYPRSASQLQTWFSNWMQPVVSKGRRVPRALIVPHAGYVYSGEKAAHGFSLWRHAQDTIRTVVVLGPAHRVAFEGISTLDFDAVDTPFGALSLDRDLRQRVLAEFSHVHMANATQAQEHSLEVQFPFIKHLLPNVMVLPLLTGRVPTEQIVTLLNYLWARNDVYFVISSDLSHFYPYDQARVLDAETAQWIEHGHWQRLDGQRACGYQAIQGVLALKETNRLRIESLGLVNSGDTAGDKSSVVGYGSWALYEEGDSVC